MQDDSRNRRRQAADSVARRCALMRERAELKRNNARRVVVEYCFRAYSPPGDLEASLVDACRVTYAEVPMPGTNLADIRTALEDLGFELYGAHPTRTHHAGRFNPTWREVWVSNGGDDEQRETIRNHPGS